MPRRSAKPTSGAAGLLGRLSDLSGGTAKRKGSGGGLPGMLSRLGSAGTRGGRSKKGIAGLLAAGLGAATVAKRRSGKRRQHQEHDASPGPAQDAQPV